MDEATAIAQLQGGNIAGLETLVRLYQRQALNVARVICQDSALAEDIVQSAFIRVYERIQQFDTSRPFGPWFLHSVANATLMAMRRTTALSLDETATFATIEATLADTDSLSQIEQAETKEAVWAAIAQLSPLQRAVIVLRYYLDMRETDIARMLHAPPGTIRRRHHDARQRLRTLLPVWIRPT